MERRPDDARCPRSVARRRRPRAHRVGGRRDAGARADQGTIREGAAARRHPRGRLPARHDRDREPDAHACRPAAPRWRSAPRTRSRPRTRSPPRWSSAGIDTYAIKGEDTDTFFKHINAVLDIRPNITMDDGADMVSVLHKQRPDQIAEIIGGTEETTTGVIRLRAMAADGALQVPDRERERRRHQAPVRQPVRHGAVDDRCDHAGDEPPARRSDDRRLRLRHVRPRGGLARPRHGRARDRHRGRPDRGDRGRDGGLPGHADPRCGPRRRHLHHADRRHQRDPRRAHGADEGRRDARELRPFRRGDRQGGARRRSEPAACDGSASSSTSTPSPTAGALYLLGEGRLGEPVGRRGPPCGRHGHVVREPGARVGVGRRQPGTLEPRVYPVPVEIDKDVARLKLRAMGVEIDELTAEQEHYLSSWEQGTVGRGRARLDPCALRAVPRDSQGRVRAARGRPRTRTRCGSRRHG